MGWSQINGHDISRGEQEDILYTEESGSFICRKEVKKRQAKKHMAQNRDDDVDDINNGADGN